MPRHNRQKYVLAGLAVATLGTLVVTQVASAHGLGLRFGPMGGIGRNNEEGLASKIATIYDLNQEDVQNTIDEYRTDQQDARLQEKVDNGDLTAEQKDLFEAKMAENKTRLDEIRNIEDENDIQEAIKALRDDMRSWAEDNNIPQQNGRGSGQGRMGMRMHDES